MEKHYETVHNNPELHVCLVCKDTFVCKDRLEKHMGKFTNIEKNCFLYPKFSCESTFCLHVSVAHPKICTHSSEILKISL